MRRECQEEVGATVLTSAPLGEPLHNPDTGWTVAPYVVTCDDTGSFFWHDRTDRGHTLVWRDPKEIVSSYPDGPSSSFSARVEIARRLLKEYGPTGLDQGND